LGSGLGDSLDCNVRLCETVSEFTGFGSGLVVMDMGGWKKEDTGSVWCGLWKLILNRCVGFAAVKNI